MIRIVPYCCNRCARFLERDEASFEDGEASCAPSCEALDLRLGARRSNVHTRPTVNPKAAP